jgi:hypothetical protein
MRYYAGLVNGEDAELATRLLPNMSGSPTPLNNILRATDIKNKKSSSSTYIVLGIMGLIVLFVFPPLFVPFVIGAFVSSVIRRNKS